MGGYFEWERRRRWGEGEKGMEKLVVELGSRCIFRILFELDALRLFALAPFSLSFS